LLGRTYKEIEEMVRAKVLSTEMARAIVRKAGFRSSAFVVGEASFGEQTIPILSLTGVAGEAVPTPCPPDFQSLIDAFHASPNDTTRGALTDYIEARL
jgi:hypothetical protein